MQVACHDRRRDLECPFSGPRTLFWKNQGVTSKRVTAWPAGRIFPRSRKILPPSRGIYPGRDIETVP